MKYLVYTPDGGMTEHVHWPTYTDDGVYIGACSDVCLWYQKKWLSFVPINDCDLPPEIKTYLLITGNNG